MGVTCVKLVGVCVVINARCVKLHYKIGTRNYKQNKAKAVEFARALTASNPALFATDVAERFLQGGKQDDLADALILVLYYLDTYSNQLHK